MNIFLWVLQIFLAFHTTAGAVWKFSNSPQAISSLKAIPQGVWLAMSVFEILCGVALILPALSKRFDTLVPIAAACIAVEMVIFCGIHLFSGETNHSPIIYWGIVAVVCAFIAYGRFVLKPL